MLMCASFPQGTVPAVYILYSQLHINGTNQEVMATPIYLMDDYLHQMACVTLKIKTQVVLLAVNLKTLVANQVVLLAVCFSVPFQLKVVWHLSQLTIVKEL